MWIPTPFYERAPQYWLFLGLFLIVTGTYLGIETDRRLLYVGLGFGLACCAWSIRTYTQRSLRRERSSGAAGEATAVIDDSE